MAAGTVVYQRTALLDLERGNGVTGSEVHEGRRQTARCEDLAVDGKARLIYRPSSRTGENPLSGMMGGTMETAASFEARFAPWSYPASRSEKLGRGGTDGELAKPLIVIQRVQIPPDQSRADRSVVSLAIHRATGGCRSVGNKEARP